MISYELASNQSLPDLWPGEFVVTPRGVGLLNRIRQSILIYENLGEPMAVIDTQPAIVRVQFGAAGPFRNFLASSVFPATAAEVRFAGLDGVGGRVRSVNWIGNIRRAS
jgi:hypothetical protein